MNFLSFEIEAKKYNLIYKKTQKSYLTIYNARVIPRISCINLCNSNIYVFYINFILSIDRNFLK